MRSRGVAETGTLVMASGPDNPTTLNFLPDTHIVVVDAKDIAGDYETVWARVREKFGIDALPRAINMITGPSRSADIAQILILGAHGPRRLHVLVVGEAGMTDTSDRYVKTGVFLAPFHATRENPLLALERDMDLLILLDKLNYHEAWIGEHHSSGFEIIACPEMFIAAAAERTRHIRLGTGVVSLPYHNPFTLAGRMMQLDYQTRGRAMFGVGPGSLVYDADKMGLKAADQRRSSTSRST